MSRGPDRRRPFTPVKEVNLLASDPLVLAAGGTSLHRQPRHRRLASARPPGACRSATRERPSRPPAAGSAACSPGPATRTASPASAPPGACPTCPPTPTATPAWRSSSATAGRTTIRDSGGTSATAPIWAALIALADQYAGRHLGFVNPAIYRIARSPCYHQAFHDITTGNNTVRVPAQDDHRLPGRRPAGTRSPAGAAPTRRCSSRCSPATPRPESAGPSARPGAPGPERRP